MTAPAAVSRPIRTIGRIPVRNLWFLFLYANDLARWADRLDMAVEDDDADLATLVARLLARAAETRLRRSLSRCYVPRSEVLTRVRGRIDLLATEAGGHLARGRIACRFEELSIDTVRNRLARSALRAIAGRAEADVAHRCRARAGQLGHLGVSDRPPSRAEMAGDVLGRNDAADRVLVALSKLALDLALPTEEEGDVAGHAPIRDAVAARKLFERAVGGFYRTELTREHGWHVHPGKTMDWDERDASQGMDAILPGMITDVVLAHRPTGRRIVIDTKFNNAIVTNRFDKRSLRSGHLFQMYAYLRSQAGRGDELADRAEGMLLHPAIGEDLLESATFQGHRISFATVDLSAEPAAIRRRLLALVDPATAQ